MEVLCYNFRVYSMERNRKLEWPATVFLSTSFWTAAKSIQGSSPLQKTLHYATVRLKTNNATVDTSVYCYSTNFSHVQQILKCLSINVVLQPSRTKILRNYQISKADIALSSMCQYSKPLLVGLCIFKLIFQNLWGMFKQVVE